MSERYTNFKKQLLKKQFSEAKLYPGYFFRATTDQVALIINLTDDEYSVTVMYGFVAIPNMADDGEWFANNGSDDTTCHVRNILAIWDDESEIAAANTIAEFYNRYRDCSKEEILTVKKERQKEFLAHFARALKPLGFKKKSATWTKELSDGRVLTFNAQKSAWSDQYYFNVSVHSISEHWSNPLCERVVMHKSDIYNWQLMSQEQIKNLVEYAISQYIFPKLK